MRHSYLICLLLITLSCSKKDDATPVTGTASYKRDGTTVNAQATYTTSTSSSGGQSFDYLTVQLTTTPQPASGAETLRLYFYKDGGKPTTAYQLTDIELRNTANPTGQYYSNQATTLNASNGDGFSGTFSASYTSLVGTIYQTTHVLSDGVFTNARP